MRHPSVPRWIWYPVHSLMLLLWTGFAAVLGIAVWVSTFEVGPGDVEPPRAERMSVVPDPIPGAPAEVTLHYDFEGLPEHIDRVRIAVAPDVRTGTRPEPEYVTVERDDPRVRITCPADTVRLFLIDRTGNAAPLGVPVER